VSPTIFASKKEALRFTGQGYSGAYSDKSKTDGRSMKRTDLEHIIRAAGSITQDDEIIIIGRVSMLQVEESIKDRILKRIKK
jgi:hypothetical protein